MLETFKHSQTASEDEDPEHIPGKQGNTMDYVFLLLFSSLLSATCVPVSMVVVVVGLQEDVMVGTVVDVVGVVVEVGQD